MMPSLFSPCVRLFLRYRVVYPFISLFPRSLSFKLATLKGYLDGLMNGEFVSSGVRGLKSVMVGVSDQQAANVIKSQARMLAREILDVFWLKRLGPNNIDRFIRLSGLQHLKEAVDSERPVILYSAHFGRLIMPSMALGVTGTPTSCLFADISNPAIPDQEQRYLSFKVKEMQYLMQGEMVHKGESLRRLYQILKSRNILIVIVDAPPGPNDSVQEFPFLGGMARLSTGVVKIARRTGALLVPYFAVEEEDGLCGHILPAIDLNGLDDAEALRQVFMPIEDYVRRRPDQWWMWQHLPAIWRPLQSDQI